MGTITFPPCRSGVTEQMLSDWQDHQLAERESQQMAAHVPTCAGCQARMAGYARALSALEQQAVPLLQPRIWRGVQSRLNRPHIGGMGRRSLGTIGVVAALALVVSFVFLLAGNRRPGISVSPTLTTQPTHTAILTAQPTHTARPKPTSTSVPPVTPEQGWGTAGKTVITLDANQYNVNDVLPAGGGILAVVDPSRSNNGPPNPPFNPPNTLVLINETTGATQTIFSTATQNVLDGGSDGRYIVWAAGLNPSGGPGASNITIGSLDLQTGQTRTLINAADTPVNQLSPFLTVTHGMLFMPIVSATNGIYEANLATGAQQMSLPASIGFSVSWPYLLLENSNTSGSGKPADPEPTALVNLVTGQQNDLTTLLNFSYYSFNSFALDGTSVFISQPNPNMDGTTQFIEIDHVDQPHPTSHVLFTLPITSGKTSNAGFAGGDSRLLMIQGIDGIGSAEVWDRVLQKLIILPTTPTTGPYFFAPMVRNGNLLYWQVANNTAQLVVWNEASLPH